MSYIKKISKFNIFSSFIIGMLSSSIVIFYMNFKQISSLFLTISSFIFLVIIFHILLFILIYFYIYIFDKLDIWNFKRNKNNE